MPFGPGAFSVQIAADQIQIFAVHIFLDQYDQTTSIAPWELIVRVAEGAAALGAERLIVSGARVGSPVSAKAGALNRAGDVLQNACFAARLPQPLAGVRKWRGGDRGA